jgi:hypothetical protein
MNDVLRKAIICAIAFNLISGNASCPAYDNVYALRSRASVNTLISHNMAERFLNNDVQDGEDGIAFISWQKNPGILASGAYANLHRASGVSTDKETAVLNSKLKKIKERLLKEGFFHEQDFNVGIRVVFPAYKSATYERRTDTITIDLRSFENEDFLYITLKHEFTDRKLPDIGIIGEQFKRYPGLRELFTLITVNIAGFISLRRNHMRRAQSMLEHYRSIVRHDNGLFRCYERIIRDPSISDPFIFTEDIFRLVENGKNKVYFPNMRESVRRLASTSKDGSIDYKLTSTVLKSWLKDINNHFFEIQNIRGKSQFRPLTDFKATAPASLRPFMQYAKNIDYELDGDCVFLRIRLTNDQGNAQFAYVYIGLNDNWDSVLGRRGTIYGLTYDKWQVKNPGIFQYRHDGVKKDRGLYWSRLIRLPITKLINEMYDDPGRGERLKKLFINLFNELGIKNNLSDKTWLSVRRILGKKKAPGSYYIINDIIWKHIDRAYPKLFLGKNNLQYIPIADMPAWLIMEDSEMSSEALSWLDYRKKHGPLSFYEHAEKVSMRDILRMLQQQEAYLQNIAPPAGPRASEPYIIQHMQSAIHLAA